MSHVSVPLPTSTFLRLVGFLQACGSDRDPVDIVEDAVDYWIDNAEWKTETLLPDAARKGGYPWKVQKTSEHPATALPLPAGTALRIKVGAGFKYAKVNGDSLVYQGEQVSPNQFAKLATGTDRDAWRDVWVKRPADQDFLHADALRHALFAS
jgi:hypothetical protein